MPEKPGTPRDNRSRISKTPKNGSVLCDRQRTWSVLITAWINAIGIEKVQHMLLNNFYYQKCPIIQQNNAWEKSSHNTVLNAFDYLKTFLPLADASNSHHISCTQIYWRKWVQFGPNLSIAIFGRCQRNQERPETAGAGHPRPQNSCVLCD